MFRQTLVVATILSLLVTGCSSDQRYKREVEGNDDYLKTSELRPLIVPDNIKVPTSSNNEYYIYKASVQGNVGMDVDIRPPSLPLPTTVDSYAYYYDGVVALDSPTYAEFWSQIPSILKSQNIAVERSDNSIIKTGTRLVQRGDELQPIEASYLLKRTTQSGREHITVELTSLKRMGQNISSSIEEQRYTVDFFNMLMNDVRSSNNSSGL